MHTRGLTSLFMILLPYFLGVTKYLVFYCLLRHGENTNALKATYIIGHRRDASASNTTTMILCSTANQRCGAEWHIPRAVLAEAMVSFCENCHWKCLAIDIAIRQAIKRRLISVIVKCARAKRLSNLYTVVTGESILSVVKHCHCLQQTNCSWEGIVRFGLKGENEVASLSAVIWPLSGIGFSLPSSRVRSTSYDKSLHVFQGGSMRRSLRICRYDCLLAW